MRTLWSGVIVVEDDLVVSPVFLNYLNTVLEHYADEQKVIQVSANMFPVSIQSTYDTVMLPFTTSWEWATWDRAWKHFDPCMSGFEKHRTDSALRRKFNLGGAPYFRMLKRQACGEVDSWAVRLFECFFAEWADGLSAPFISSPC